MDKDDRRKSSLLLPSRRSALIMAGAAGLMVARPALGALVATPGQTAGPFYPLSKPDDNDANLTRVIGRQKRASGIAIDVVGRVFDVRGHVLGRVWVEIWQADAFGAYHHPRDPNSTKADPNFQGYAVVQTGQDSAYRFRTIKPRSYQAGSILRTPHIHFHIIQDSASRLVTQMYFPNERLNRQDVLFGELDSAADKAAATARIINAGSPVQYQYDIVI